MGQLRFKLRSGTGSLHFEKGRKSRKEEDRMSSACEIGTEEYVELFKFVLQPQKSLVTLCDKVSLTRNGAAHATGYFSLARVEGGWRSTCARCPKSSKCCVLAVFCSLPSVHIGAHSSPLSTYPP